MRSYLPRFALEAPATLGDVLALLASEPGRWRPLAGGTDVMVTLGSGTPTHTRFVNIRQLHELRGIVIDDRGLTIGALTTYTDLRNHPAVRDEWPLLVHAAAQTGGIATQNRGTIGGNIANGSPAADTPPVLIAYDAEIELTSMRGMRRVPYDRFHTGYKRMDLAGDELITAVRLPRRREPWTATFRKVGTRRAQAISKVSFAAAALVGDHAIADVRLAFGSVAPTVVRAVTVERAIRGRSVRDVSPDALTEALAADVHPIDDVRSTRAYRFAVARNLLTGFLATLERDGRVAGGDSR